jgi:peptidoglycan/LPS O-acetylase OafA/YrhL
MEKQGSFRCITLLRAVACLLVLWSHTAGMWPAFLNFKSRGLEFVQANINRPLGISQNFGFLGVAIFFFVSGFIISHASQNETRRAFLIKRLLRIYPPFIVAVLLMLACAYAYWQLTGAIILLPDLDLLGIKDVLLAMSLGNYLVPGGKYMVIVAWTLCIELIFYALVWAVLPLLQRRPGRALLLMSVLSVVCISLGPRLGETFALLAAVVAFLPALIGGACTYFLYAGRLRTPHFLALLLFNYGAFIHGLRVYKPAELDAGSQYAISLVYGYAIFVIALLLEEKLALPRPVELVARISYSLYLTHYTVSSVLGVLLIRRIGFITTLPLIAGVALLLSYLSWRYVEEPSRRLARRLAGPRLAAPAPPLAREEPAGAPS